MYMIFFFFKQKTAYEVRISDWSSDVCSSDLMPDHPDLPRTQLVVQPNWTDLYGHMNAARYVRVFDHVGFQLLDPLGVGESHTQAKIGRASCRARVCQYV